MSNDEDKSMIERRMLQQNPQYKQKSRTVYASSECGLHV